MTALSRCQIRRVLYESHLDWAGGATPAHLARLFCDLESQSLKIGEFQHLAGQVESGSTFVTAIGDVLLGRKSGRQTRDEITVFDSSGLALQDLFVASQLLKAAHAERN